MFPVGPAPWPRLRVLWALWALLVVLLAPWRLWAIQETQECTWQVVLNNLESVGKNDAIDHFVDQELYTVDKVFDLLVDAPIDRDEVRGLGADEWERPWSCTLLGSGHLLTISLQTYLGFPYYLKINYSCTGEVSSEALVRKGHLTGLKPVVLVTFQSPVNFHRWKIEQLQIQMEAAPFRSPAERCDAEEMCLMSWYTPMPIKNGSVVMRVDVSSNGLGPFIPNKRFHVNINGFLERGRDHELQFTVGNELFHLIPRHFVNVPSRPLWYTVDQTPVLILGGIPEEKAILLTDTNFKDFFLVEQWLRVCDGPHRWQERRLRPLWDHHSFNSENFIYLADFPKELSIKYLVNSFRGDMAIVTENEEIWYLLEGSYQVYQLFPSKAWEVYISLQVLQQSSRYAPNETMVTLFYEDNKLYQLVYLIDHPHGRLIKRLMPVEQLLMYQQISKEYVLERQGSHLTLSFSNFCPFTVMRLQELPNPQIYTRQERYRAQPPHVLEPWGFHSENSLAVYQGLVYYLLSLHSKYDKPYADPVHDPTWRWWKNKKQDQDYYFYLANNWRSAGGVHVDMTSYEKIYDLKAENELPERIFLDKGTSYSFSVFLTTRKPEVQHGPSFQVLSPVDLAVVLADPDCIEAMVKEKVLVNRNSVLFWVTLSDKRSCFDQGISGHHLMKTSMLVKVLGSSGHCFQNTNRGPRMQSNLMVPVLIGCPPGKRLAFDITYTLQYNRVQNKHYFDCVKVDPEMPCFLFRDIFYPFFLIQDLVTGDSGSFQGSYVLKVVGGGPTLDTIKEYSEEEIYRFNSPLDKTGSLIWTTENTTTTEDLAFNIMSHNSLGIEWLCLENSPCHDTIPHNIFAPEFFFKVLVSNRGVDESTYCDYQLTFLLHIHGLPLSARRAFLILLVSASLFVGLVILYIVCCLLSPYMVKLCNILRWKINSIIGLESNYTYSTPSDSRAFSHSGTVSWRSSRLNSRVVYKGAEENKAET
ncbi:PREDICTED: cation channel sperm-associated protein subunit gamma isoform X10 [Bison bison bison]|uniref:Cation channel sperm-associated protein subunit gamma isoform X10 n=1 Tax=Bison bison bison TaxID=43346 RepID=A0A6P3I9D2_BISBB|nr:PREDICTED: cation channel sperm-associated protein subunit gamma isoform X10 [Bison bison bison]